MMIRKSLTISMEVELNPGEFPDIILHPRVELRISDRNYPIWITVPFQLAGTIRSEHSTGTPGNWDAFDRRVARQILARENGSKE